MTLPPAGGGRLSRLPAALSCPREAERKAMPPLAGRRMPLPLTAIADGKNFRREQGKSPFRGHRGCGFHPSRLAPYPAAG